MLMIVPWNLMRRRTLFSKSDIYIISVAKSGRTWFRVLLNKYLSLAHDIPFSLEDLSKQSKKIPSILFTHELWEHYSKATLLQKIFGKYIIPKKMLWSKKVVVLYRDPRDVLVSLYYHKRKRSERRTEKTIKDFMSDRRHGIPLIVHVMNQWRHRLEHHPACYWVSYEALKHDTLEAFLGVLGFLIPNNIKEPLARQAVAFAEFENMKKMEADGAFGSKIIRPGIPSDPDSFKVRKGKVGGYVNHFSNEDLQRLDGEIAKLNPFFNYHVQSG
jgi:hypothetical protein